MLVFQGVDWCFQSVFSRRSILEEIGARRCQAEVNDDIEESPWVSPCKRWDALSNSVKIARSNDVDPWIERIDSWEFLGGDVELFVARWCWWMNCWTMARPCRWSIRNEWSKNPANFHGKGPSEIIRRIFLHSFF